MHACSDEDLAHDHHAAVDRAPREVRGAALTWARAARGDWAVIAFKRT